MARAASGIAMRSSWPHRDTGVHRSYPDHTDMIDRRHRDVGDISRRAGCLALLAYAVLEPLSQDGLDQV